MTELAASPDRVHADAKALVLYASTHGHTAKIAARIAQAIRHEGLQADLHEVSDATDPADYDVIVVAASLHKEHHQSAVAEWVTTHRDALALRPSAFLSVSLSAAEDSDTARAATQGCIDTFCETTGWAPTRTERIAGCLEYREYDVFTRQLMRLLMKRMGHPTDASRDYDYTDWEAVDLLGAQLARLAAVPAAAGGG